MEPMVVMAARAAQTVGQELLKAHQNRHKLDLQVEEKGIDGPVTRVDRYLEQLTIDTLRKSYKNHSFLVKSLVCKKAKVTMQIGAGSSIR
jgi:myo-inositol-1(or 4)-monophosphatase